jgi:dimethylamine/trimethylamine dehydrogenase
MRGVKAEGGWAVVSAEEVEIHVSSDLTPFIEGRLWDDRDIPALALMTEAIHRYGALAAIELVHAGMNAANLSSREVSIAPSGIANPASYAPVQARAMSKADIADYRRWHRNAALRARRAGFNIIYVYAGHGLSLAMHFLQSRHNHQADEYGGSRQPNEALALELASLSNAVSEAGIASITSIGDCWAPSTIAAAVYAEHRHAREFDLPSDNDVGFRRELTALNEV